MGSYERNSINYGKRIRNSVIFVAVMFSVLVIRLWYLQIIKGDYFREQSEGNRFKQVYLPAPRGEILDRNGKVLVANRPAFNIELIKEDCPDPEKTLRKLSELLNISFEELKQKAVQPQAKRRVYEPKLLLADVSRDVVAKVYARKYDLPGIVVNVRPARVYPEGEFASHVLGYLREISDRQLESGQYPSYRRGDLIGQTGIEQLHEFLLFGKRGVQHLIVNAVGTRVGELYNDQDIPGHQVRLTIDYSAQLASEQAMLGKTGAVVAMNPQTGEILAITSRPSFDPNVFSGPISPSVWADLNDSKTRKLSNRAISGMYHPGSVFKIFMSVAGLSEGIISPDKPVTCNGSFRVGKSRPFHCHKRAGHGAVDLATAMMVSCNVYFYNLGQQLGVDRIHDYATRFGLGVTSGIQISGEKSGLIPSTAWKKKAFSNPSDQRWYPGETPSVSIGQGAVVVTPVQVARAMSALVNGGKLYQPLLVKEISTRENVAFQEKFSPQVLSELGVESWILDEVRKILVPVVNNPKGTAYNRGRLADELGVKMAGKTGTAQTMKLENSPDDSNDIAWFAGYAPLENPEIVIVALVERGGHGGESAAPIAKSVVEAFFRGKQNAN